MTFWSKDINTVEAFVGEREVIFATKMINGKDISSYSVVLEAQEMIIIFGTRICVKSNPLTFRDYVLTVHLEEEFIFKQNTQW